MITCSGAGVNENGPFVERWKWSRPDVRVYISLILGLAASLKVSDALRMINNICRVGVSPAEEVKAFLFFSFFFCASFFQHLVFPRAITFVFYKETMINSYLSALTAPHLFLMSVLNY